MSAELQFPPTCPNPKCARLLLDTAEPHCKAPHTGNCAWLQCRCGAVIDQAGHHFLGPARKS